MGAFVGKIALENGKGTMIDFKYVDGATRAAERRRSEEAAAGGLMRSMDAHRRSLSPQRAGRDQILVDELQRLPVSGAQRALHRVRAVLCRRRPVADLRRHPHHQYRARVPLYAGDLHRLHFATRIGGGLGFWGGIVATALLVGVIGALIEILLLRRIYRAPELFQLLATFALVLVINDATLWLWGPEDLLGPRAPGLRGAIEVLGRRLPSYDMFLMVIGPVVLLMLHLALAQTRFGRLIRAATQDREMVGALGVNQAMLFTAVFALGAALAGLGGALQVAREPANLATDLIVIGDAFVVVVVGGMGSITGAYLAAVIIAEVKALCIGLGVVDFGFIYGEFLQVDAGRGISGNGGGADRAALRPLGRRRPQCARSPSRKSRSVRRRRRSRSPA